MVNNNNTVVSSRRSGGALSPGSITTKAASQLVQHHHHAHLAAGEGHLSATSWPKPHTAEPRAVQYTQTASKPPQLQKEKLPKDEKVAEVRPRKAASVKITKLDESDVTFNRILRLATRFLNPPGRAQMLAHSPQQQQHDSGSSVLQVTGIEAIHCPEQLQQFEYAKANHLIGKATTVVTKFLDRFDRDSIEHRGALVEEVDAVTGPLGNGLYFPNTFTADTAAVGSSSSTSPPRHSNSSHQQQLLLCEVAQGSICLNTSTITRGLSEVEIAQMSSPAASMDDVRSLFRKKGFDSGAANLFGAPHVAVFHCDAVVPTHIIHYSATHIPSSTSRSSSRCQKQEEKDDEVDLEEKQKREAAEKMQQRARTMAQEQDDIRLAAKKLRDVIHQRCRDLEQSVRARRDNLLAAVRQAEESELAVASRPCSARPTTGAPVSTSSRSVTADGIILPPQQQQQSQFSSPSTSTSGHNGVRHATLDTSRIMALLENLDLLCLKGTSSSPPTTVGSLPVRPASSSAASSPDRLRQQLQQQPPPRPSTSSGGGGGTASSRPPLPPPTTSSTSINHNNSNTAATSATSSAAAPSSSVEGVTSSSRSGTASKHQPSMPPPHRVPSGGRATLGKARNSTSTSSSSTTTTTTGSGGGTTTSHQLGQRPSTSPGLLHHHHHNTSNLRNGAGGSGGGGGAPTGGCNSTSSSSTTAAAGTTATTTSSALARPMWGKGSGPRALAQAAKGVS